MFCLGILCFRGFVFRIVFFHFNGIMERLEKRIEKADSKNESLIETEINGAIGDA